MDRHGRGVYETGLNNGTMNCYLLNTYVDETCLDGRAIVDEVQCSSSEMYSVLTRITEGGKLVLPGDANQIYMVWMV